VRIPRVAPLAVDPEALSAAGAAVVAAGDAVAAALGASTAGFSANTGQDAAGEVFGLAYQDAAESLLKAAAAGVNALRYNGAKIELCASNYSKAEAASTLGGGGGVLPAPGEPVKISAPRPPGTLGPGVAAPLLWAVVEALIDDVWPNGDVAGLHAAAGRWRGFGAALTGVQDALNRSKAAVGGQQIPEGGLIEPVLSTIGTDMADLGAQCAKLATTLDSFADDVAHAQNAIRDLLHRLGTVSGLFHEVVSFLDGDALEEIKRIAADINALLHNMKRQAQAKAQVVKDGMQVIDGWVCGMEKYMRGEFTHFLGQGIGNQVATAFDTFVNTDEGILKGAVGLVQTGQQLDPMRFLFDPRRAAASWSALAETAVKSHPLYALFDPNGALKNDLGLLKGLVHAEDWRTDRPGLGFGENLFDVATLFVPGAGEAGAGAKGAAAGTRAAEAGADAADAAGTAGRAGRAAGELEEVAGARSALTDVGKTGSGLTKDLENLGGELPKSDPPLGGSPVGLPAPAEAAPRPMDSATGGKPPVDPPGSEPREPAVGPHGPAPEPAGGPQDPASTAMASPHDPVSGGPHEPVGPYGAMSMPAAGWDPPSVPALPGEHVPPTVPQLAEPSSARVPASPGGAPVEPALAAAPSTQSVPALASAAPHGSAPHFTAPGGRPSELPAPHADGPRLPGDGGPFGSHPHGRAPHGGGLHGPGHGDAPRGGRPHETPPPQDGTPHGPAGGAHQHDASSTGLSSEKRDEIISTPKGTRPDPSDYLSPEYIKSHLDKFTDGATRFVPESNLDKYGIAQRDGTSFVMPKNEADAILEAAGSDLRMIENELGLPNGFLDSNKIVRIDIDDPEAYDLRIPSGNEAGANEQWIPGGLLPNGVSEAVVDGGKIPPGDYSVTNIFE
jgi:hypothetical protein